MEPLTPYAIAQALCDRLTDHRAAARLLTGPHGQGAMALLEPGPLVLIPDPPAVRLLDRSGAWVRLDLGYDLSGLPGAVVEILAHHRTALSTG
ncbi:MAG TPA: hypothetical protein VKZ89_18265 [Thermobifida alba]|nr:hypothetical protein [Thermobifida alba]